MNKLQLLARAQAILTEYQCTNITECITQIELEQKPISTWTRSTKDSLQDAHRRARAIYEECSRIVLLYNGESSIESHDIHIRLPGASDYVIQPWDNIKQDLVWSTFTESMYVDQWDELRGIGVRDVLRYVADHALGADEHKLVQTHTKDAKTCFIVCMAIMLYHKRLPQLMISIDDVPNPDKITLVPRIYNKLHVLFGLSTSDTIVLQYIEEEDDDNDRGTRMVITVGERIS